MRAGSADQMNLDLYLPRAPILGGADIARIMGFPTTEALYKARQAGRLPIELFQLPGRRGWFAATQSVREWLQSSLKPAASRPESRQEEVPMD